MRRGRPELYENPECGRLRPGEWSGARVEELIGVLSGHPLTQLVVVVAVCAAASALFGLLKALRGPVGMLAYGGLILTLYAYYRIGDRYFSQAVWQITVACLVVMWVTLRRVPFLRVVLIAALIEFGSRINRTAYPHQTVLALGITGAMIAVATFWTGPAAPAPPEPPAAVYRRGPETFGPYAGGRRPQRRGGARSALSTFWGWARGR